MLMDDTVILATTKERLIEKLDILNDFCDSHGMIVNESKTKFMVINGDSTDKHDISWYNDVTINHCEKYVYLGSVFTADGSTISSISYHVKDKEKHLNKLIIFMNTNRDFPFYVKRKVLEAAFNAALLYSCESWLDVSCQEVDKMYMGAIKCLLSVRKTTANDLCLIETGMPALGSLIKQKQHNFLCKLVTTRESEDQDPFMFALTLAKTHHLKLSRYIEAVISTNNYIDMSRQTLLDRLSLSDRSKFITYRNVNPLCTVHDVYFSKSPSFIPEFYRIEFSRLRLSSHNLRIETGRWSRIPRDHRLCPCGAVQDEQHVLTQCILTQSLRDNLTRPLVYPDLFYVNDSYVFKYIYDVMCVFSRGTS